MSTCRQLSIMKQLTCGKAVLSITLVSFIADTNVPFKHILKAASCVDVAVIHTNTIILKFFTFVTIASKSGLASTFVVSIVEEETLTVVMTVMYNIARIWKMVK